MKKILLSTVLLLVAIAGWAQTTFTDGDLTYTVTDDEAKTVSIKATSTSITGDLVIPSSVTNEEVSYSVTRIEAEAFKSSSITSVSIPASVQTIGNEAFNFINALVSVRIEDGDTPLTLENDYWGAFHNGDAGSEQCTKTIYLGRNIVSSVENRSCTEFNTVEELTIGPKVTALGDNAFNGCTGLQSVDLSNATSLTSIGVSAFYGCSNLASIDLSQSQLTTISDNTFFGCSKMTSITMPSTVTRIGEAAFKQSGITSVSIPASVQTIGNEAFNFIDALASVRIEDGDTPLTLENNYYGAFQNGDASGSHYTKTIYLGRNIVTSVADRARTEFDTVEELTIGPKVTAIGDNAFNGCTGLQSVDMSNATSLTSIGVSAFYGCSNLASIDLSQLQLTAISDNTFYGCSKLTSITIPSTVTRIGAAAFRGLAITSVSIPASVQTIGNEAFNFIDALESVTIEDGDTPLTLENNYYGAFQNGEAGGNHFTKTIYLGRNIVTSVADRARTEFDTVEELTIGPKVTAIGDNAFNGCTGLQSVDMSNATSLTSIGVNAFYGCSNLASIDHSQLDLMTIGEGAFYGCSKLTTLALGRKLTAIPENMLFGCSALTGITIPASVQSVGAHAFYDCDGLTAITIEDSETALQWNGTGYHPLDQVNSNYTLYLGRDLTTEGNQCFFPGATSVEIGDQMTTVNPYLFDGANKLASVTMGSGVTTIGDYAFQNTGTDESVTAQSIALGANVITIGDYAFSGCNKLTTLALGRKLTAIPENMLFGCSALTGITIPASVQSVGAHAFYDCDGLTAITIEDSETALQWNGTGYHPLDQVNSNYTLYLGRNLTTEADQCFFPGAISVEFGPQVTSINSNLFQDCASLSNINMTNATSLTSIGAYAFDGAGNGDSVDELSVTLGNSVTTIGARAFNDCDKINTITIPASVTTIEANAFWNMNGDLNLTIEDSETPLTINAEDLYYPIFEYKNITGYIGRNILRTGNYENEPVFSTSSDYQHHLTFGPKVTAIGDKEYYDCDGLLTVSGMENVVSIGNQAFRSCGNLTSISLGTKLQTIGIAAFAKCEALTAIELPATLKVLTNPSEDVRFGVFEGCSSLATVTLLEGLEEIGHYAFYNCSALTSITIPSTVTTIGRAPFFGCNAMKDMVLTDGDTPIQFNNEPNGFSSGRYNLTPACVLTNFYLGRDINRQNTTTHSLVYDANNIEIGPKVTDIELFFTNTGNNTAYEDQVQTVKVHAVTPIAIQEKAFHNTTFTNATLLVPGGTTAAYAADDNNWKKFANIAHYSTLVTLTATAHGSIATAEATASNGTEQYRQPKTDAVVYTLTADEGYELTALTDNGVAVSPLPALGAAQTRVNTEGEELVTLNATFSAISYTLTYTLDGGTATNPATYNVETETFTLTNPTKNGYDFAGWKLKGEGEALMEVTIAKGSIGNKAYTATWTPIIYNIDLTLDGGEAENPSTYTIESAAFTLTNPTKTGHTFKGWKLNGEGDAMMEVAIAQGSTGDLAYTATWQVNQYTITFNSNGGSDIDPITLDYGSSVTVPDAPTRDGFEFAGWTPALPETMPAENITVTASWTVNTFIVSITGAGVTADKMNPEYGDNVTITIVADEDRTLNTLTVNGVDVTEDVADGQYTIENVTGNVTVVATFNSTKEFITLPTSSDYVTFSCSQDLDFSGVMGLKAYIASGYDKSTGTVLLTRVESVPAGTGLLLRGTAGETYKVPYSESAAYYVNMLKPVLEATTVAQTESDGAYTNYFLGKQGTPAVVGFYKGKEDGTAVAAQKAYLQLPTSAVPAGAKSIGIYFDDTTAVGEVKANAMAPEGVYDINGRKIPAGQKLTRGIYVINGKKVSIK